MEDQRSSNFPTASLLISPAAQQRLHNPTAFNFLSSKVQKDFPQSILVLVLIQTPKKRLSNEEAMAVEKEDPSQPKKRKTVIFDGTSTVPHADPGAIFRGIAAATRKLLPVAGKAMKANRTVAINTIRTVGKNRPLAFASEGAVAGQSMLPKIVYYGAWTLSGVAITADITTKYWDAPPDKQIQTAVYWTAFHVPASLVVPAAIIHQVVHAAETSVKSGSYAKSWPPRAKAMAPVGAALLAIIPVVPVVDTLAEYAMEPTLGKYLGLEFSHHHGSDESAESKAKQE